MDSITYMQMKKKQKYKNLSNKLKQNKTKIYKSNKYAYTKLQEKKLIFLFAEVSIKQKISN